MDIEQIIKRAILYIHTMYDKPITVSDIALHLYLSPSYFSFIFRTMTGYTVKNYLNRYRLYCAAKALKESKEQIVDIALNSGFSSQQAFTKSFSKMYGITPAQFRLQSPSLDLFKPKNLLKERILSMDIKKCFENVNFIHKDKFFVVGVEVDINYNTEGGTDPISTAWKIWDENNLSLSIPDQINCGVSYGITHSETSDDTGKYIVCCEVTSLDNLPVGLVGRCFEACDFAVFDTTIKIIESGDFWRAFYSKWLPQSEYRLPDESLHEHYCTFNRYPSIEVYCKDFEADKSILQIYAPVVKK